MVGPTRGLPSLPASPPCGRLRFGSEALPSAAGFPQKQAPENSPTDPPLRAGGPQETGGRSPSSAPSPRLQLLGRGDNLIHTYIILGTGPPEERFR